MTGSSDLAPYLRSGEPDVTYHQGTIIDWNASTGNNIVRVGATDVTDLPVLATSDSVLLAPGDTVLVMRWRSVYSVVGRFAPAGAGSLGIRVAQIAATSYITTTSYGDLDSTIGPTLTDVYIGSSRQCLVTVSTAIYPAINATGAAHFTVTGASTINPPTGSSAFSEGAFLGAFSGTDTPRGSVTKEFLLTAAHGLNQGLHTFTVKYLATSTAIDDTFFSDRVIKVQPL